MNIKRSMILLGVLILILLWAVISLYPNWLWFRNLNFAPVFWTMLIGKFGLATVIWFFMRDVDSQTTYYHNVVHQYNSLTSK